ncbi:retrovirus-related pol polyprotein from transposon TNT 1-94 [Tanacetum coccineum]|uniref:Retrovirus-related pol polyprotein from transposon TNT 1-94 n=1 Tax=Tanacetum coccineum TaxID=301880 RepID=A0ABQ5DRU6_9ASTR
MRTVSTAAKPYQEDSLKLYLITGNIHTDQRGTVVIGTVFEKSEQILFRPYLLIITNLNLQVFLMVTAPSQGRVRFIAACSYSTNICKDIMKAQVHVSRLPLLSYRTSYLKRRSAKVKELQERLSLDNLIFYTKNDRVPSMSKSSCIKNKEVEVEEHHRNLLLSKNKKHMSFECNNIKLAIRNAKTEVVCAMCKQCLITTNNDVCVLKYVNDMNSHGKKQKPEVKKPKKVGSKERLASPTPSEPSITHRWSPTGRTFDCNGKIINSRVSKGQSNCDNACTSNPQEPSSKRFPNPTSFLVRFRNDHVAVILGFGDLQWGNILITRVYFIEGLGHNLFSVGQFCGSNLEVTFRRNTYFVRNLKGGDLLKGNRTTNLYTIILNEMASASPTCLMARATSTKSWLWHQRLSHLNFDTINDLAKNDLVTGLSKFKYHKEHLCFSCKQGKSKRASHPPKPVPNSKQRLHLLHMDLCCPMRVESINRKRVGISHQASSVRTPQQNGVVKQRNCTLVEAARTILIFSPAPLLLWAEAIATACYTQNRSIIHRQFGKTPYELITGRKLDISFLHVIGALCYPKNDCEDIRKLSAKGDIGFFIGYSTNSCAYRVYNRRTKKIIETMNVTFDELLTMAFEQSSSKTRLQTMYDDYLGGQPSAAPRTTTAAQTPQDVDELESQQQHVQQQVNQDPLPPELVADNVSNAMLDGNTFVNPFAPPSTNGDMWMYAFVSTMEPSKVKEAMKDHAWINSMQEELLHFK